MSKSIENMKQTDLITRTIAGIVEDHPWLQPESISEELNARGIKTVKGIEWNKMSVYRWLRVYEIDSESIKFRQDVKHRSSSVRKLIKLIKKGKLIDECMRRAKRTISNLEAQGI